MRNIASISDYTFITYTSLSYMKRHLSAYRKNHKGHPMEGVNAHLRSVIFPLLAKAWESDIDLMSRVFDSLGMDPSPRNRPYRGFSGSQMSVLRELRLFYSTIAVTAMIAAEKEIVVAKKVAFSILTDACSIVWVHSFEEDWLV